MSIRSSKRAAASGLALWLSLVGSSAFAQLRPVRPPGRPAPRPVQRPPLRPPQRPPVLPVTDTPDFDTVPPPADTPPPQAPAQPEQPAAQPEAPPVSSHADEAPPAPSPPTTTTPPEAQPPQPAPEQPPASTPPAQPPPADPDRPAITLTGWSDLYFSYNVNAPSNGLNALRLYDAKHDHVGFNSLAFDVGWSIGPVAGHAVLQLGTLLSEFYPYAGTVTRVQQELPFRLMQEVTLGWSPTLGGRRPLTIEGGIFVAPFGVEYIQIYKNWNWSPSNLFYICPFQITGLRASWAFNDRWTARVGVYSGWDQIVDDSNAFRSVLLQGEYTLGERFFLSAQYMVGVERERGAVEGPWTRHAFDLYADYQPLERLQVRGHVFAGLEPNRLGTAGWLGVALYARVKAFDWLYVAARGDIVREWVPEGGQSMFGLDAGLLGSVTVTAELLPHRHLSFRVEYRHDHADANQYFRDNVPRARMTGDDLPNATSQDTITAGATAWF